MSSKVLREMHKKRVQYDRNPAEQDNEGRKDDVLNYIRRYNPTTNKYEIVFQDQLDK